MKCYDVIVVGGGPAGCAAALALIQRGFSVLIVERSTYRDWRVGETLLPQARQLMVALGVLDRFLENNPLSCDAIYEAWGDESLYEHAAIFNPYGAGWHLDRQHFDAMLAQVCEDSGVHLWRETHMMHILREREEWQVSVKRGTQIIALQARFIVDATGRTARIARACHSQKFSYDRLLGLVGILGPQSPQSSTEGKLLLEASETGWWYSVPLSDGRLLVAWMTDTDLLTSNPQPLLATWASQLGRTTHTWAHVQAYHLPQAIQACKADTCRLDKVAGAGWMAIGDAAYAFDPLSGNGITKALQSGLSAAEMIGDYFLGDHTALENYQAHSNQVFANYLKQRAAYYQREQRWPDSHFWRRRHALTI